MPSTSIRAAPDGSNGTAFNLRVATPALRLSAGRTDTGAVRVAGVDVADRTEGAPVAARDALGPVVKVYVDARTDDEPV